VQLEYFSGVVRGVDCRFEGAAGVHDEQIAWSEPLRQIEEPRVLDRVSGNVGDEQANLVAPEPARFGRFGRFEMLWQCGLRIRLAEPSRPPTRAATARR
jgi:hypothetical protein